MRKFRFVELKEETNPDGFWNVFKYTVIHNGTITLDIKDEMLIEFNITIKCKTPPLNIPSVATEEELRIAFNID